jgi:hypothetical protein
MVHAPRNREPIAMRGPKSLRRSSPSSLGRETSGGGVPRLLSPENGKDTREKASRKGDAFQNPGIDERRRPRKTPSADNPSADLLSKNGRHSRFQLYPIGLAP